MATGNDTAVEVSAVSLQTFLQFAAATISAVFNVSYCYASCRDPDDNFL